MYLPHGVCKVGENKNKKLGFKNNHKLSLSPSPTSNNLISSLLGRCKNPNPEFKNKQGATNSIPF